MEDLVGSCSGFHTAIKIAIKMFYASDVMVFGELFDDGKIVEDPSNSSICDNPGVALRSSRLDLSNTSSDRREGVDTSGAIMRLFNVKGLDHGVSSHGEHGVQVIVGKLYIMYEVW